MIYTIIVSMPVIFGDVLVTYEDGVRQTYDILETVDSWKTDAGSMRYKVKATLRKSEMEIQ